MKEGIATAVATFHSVGNSPTGDFDVPTGQVLFVEEGDPVFRFNLWFGSICGCIGSAATGETRQDQEEV